MKTCGSCKVEQPLTEFYKDCTKLDGLRTTCKTCKKACDKTYAKCNAETISEKRKERYLKRYDIERSQQAEYARNNRDVFNKHARSYRKNNRGKVNAATRARQAAKLNATPLWADLEQIKRVYIACAKISERTGVEHHVDHIIPLQGKNVCGLHVEKNLAIISAKANLEKSNTFAPWAID